MSTKSGIDRMAGPPIGPDGMTKAFTVEEQWARIGQWHRLLVQRTGEGADAPAVFGEGLEEAWERISEIYEVHGRCVVERGDVIRSVASTPLAALFFHVEMGFYPPPELLLALNDSWAVYTANVGFMSLEEAFLGPPKKRAGNYSARKHAQFQRMYLEQDFQRLLAQGIKREEAAEILSQKLGGKPEAESILRIIRRSRSLRKKRADK